MAKTQTINVATALTAAASFTSPAYALLGSRSVGLSATVTGATTPASSIAIQASNDGVNYAVITSVAISANGTNLITLTSIPYQFIRVNYTYTSGTGGTFDSILCVVGQY